MASLKKRGRTYYLQYYIGNVQRRVNLQTENYQIAKEKQRQFESARQQGAENPLPTQTPIGEVLARYVGYIRGTKTAKSAQTDIYYLREIFGAVCPALEITSRKVSPKCKKRPNVITDGRYKTQRIEAAAFEQITTADISDFIAAQVRTKGIMPKTANRYREIICRLFNWSMQEGGVRMPNGKNPAAAVGRYKERAPEIRFLTLAQIDEQLKALDNMPQMQIMVSMFIYAGLRREELLWLTREDVDLTAGHNGMIRIRAKTINGEFWEPKTKSNRAVPISRALRGWLECWTLRPSLGDWYFPSPQGHRYDPDNFSRDLREANEKAGLRWNCLDYRHTFGSQLAMKGESLYKISALMGNSPEICRRHYAALLPETMADSVEFLKSDRIQMIG